jgi:RNA methyltransferase, TrmH family
MPLGIGEWQDVVQFARQHGLQLLAAAPASGAAMPYVAQASELLHKIPHCKVALVLGSEGHGLREDAIRDCVVVSIPMASGVESLNVASAGAIYMSLLSPIFPSVLGGLVQALPGQHVNA